MLGRGGVGLGGPAREQPRVGVGAEGQDEHRARRGGGGVLRSARLELQQLQRLGGQAELLPDGARAEHPAVAVLAAEVDAPRRGGRGAVEGGDEGRRREAHLGGEVVGEEAARGGEEARAGGEGGCGEVEGENAGCAADGGVAEDEELGGRRTR